MRVIFGCESARKGSYQAIRTFPLGYASYSQTEVNTLLSRQKSSYSIHSGPKVIHNEHCFQSATDFLIYMQIAILFSLHTGRTHEDYLEEFDRLIMQSKFGSTIINSELIELWDSYKPYLSNRTKISRHNIIRSFCEYLYAHDHCSFVPDRSKVKNTSTFFPYIFTEEEISRLIGAADNLPQRKNAPYREIVLPAIYRVLYCCGLRVNEALRLKITDCNFKEGTLFIRNGKGGKDRIVPMHPTLTAYLSDYCSKLPDNAEWLFPSSKGHYSQSTVYENFREMLVLCKIPHTGKGPRVHDFRHTFCVHTLEKQLAAGHEPMQIMPRMAAYLGHKSYRETSWYIHLTIVSFPELSAKLSAVFSGIIPVVEGSKDEENRLF